MKKLKLWLQPTKNKVFMGILISILIGISTVSIYALTRPAKPQISFKENIVLEYGSVEDREWASHIEDFNRTEGADGPIGAYLLDKEKQIWVYSLDEYFEETHDIQSPTYQLPDIIDIDNSKFDLIKIVGVDTSKVGEFTSKVIIELNSVEIEFEFDYEVMDTQKPQFNLVADIETPFNTEPLFSDLIKATDVVDGDLEVVITGDVNYTIPGVYKIKATATDKNKNISDLDLTVTVLEEAVLNNELEANSQNTPPANNPTSQTPGSETTPNESTSGAASNNVAPAPVPTPPPTPAPVPAPTPPTSSPEDEWLAIGYYLYHTYDNVGACSAVIFEIQMEHVETWKGSTCDTDGSLYYELY